MDLSGFDIFVIAAVILVILTLVAGIKTVPQGYRYTVEHSVYVLDAAQGKGLGKLLLAALIEEARGMGKRVMVGAIDAANYASLALHETMGFEETGRMPGVGEKFGKRLDLVLVQLTL